MKCFLVFLAYAPISRTFSIENDKESPYRQRLEHATSSSTASAVQCSLEDMLFVLLSVGMVYSVEKRITQICAYNLVPHLSPCKAVEGLGTI